MRASPGAVVLPGRSQRPKPVKTTLEEDEFTEVSLSSAVLWPAYTTAVDISLPSTQAMAKIIRRDFFPEVPKLQAQLAYMESTDSNDPEKLKEISERFAAVANDTPAVGEREREREREGREMV